MTLEACRFIKKSGILFRFNRNAGLLGNLGFVFLEELYEIVGLNENVGLYENVGLNENAGLYENVGLHENVGLFEVQEYMKMRVYLYKNAGSYENAGFFRMQDCIKMRDYGKEGFYRYKRITTEKRDCAGSRCFI